MDRERLGMVSSTVSGCQFVAPSCSLGDVGDATKFRSELILINCVDLRQEVCSSFTSKGVGTNQTKNLYPSCFRSSVDKQTKFAQRLDYGNEDKISEDTFSEKV